jgi:L-asparagine oxygenase
MGVTIYRNMEIGDVPATPPHPHIDESITTESRKSLIDMGSILGLPVSYQQEQGGRLIQNLVPVHKTEYQQISTSSKVELEMHTETAFHPYRPSHVLLLCLRGDDSAVTTYANDFEIVEKLSDEAINVLQKPWFTTQVDESFRTNGEPNMKMTTSILRKNDSSQSASWKLTYDSSFMEAAGIDDKSQIEAERALEEMRNAVNNSIQEVVLKTGDLMIINNDTTVHGRRPFQPRYDGTDRWIQRMLVVRTYPPKDHISGHIITTKFRANV